jgi:DNA polymerase-3 subunit alpha
VAKKYPFRGRGFYFIKGKVVEDFGVFMIEVTIMEKIGLVNKRELPNENSNPSDELLMPFMKN